MVSTVVRGESSVIVALVIGTLAGVLVKYSLDKRYIFRYRASSAVHEVRTFMVYALLSGVTTIIFWGFELGFGAVFQSAAARYLGGGIGLVIGYFVKYALDKKYTFTGGANIHPADLPGQL
jgi:putative flippase GtrA